MSTADPRPALNAGCADSESRFQTDTATDPQTGTHAGSHSFPPARRILKTDEFSSVFSLRPVQRSQHFVLYVRPSEHAQSRLGIVAAKRFAPRAVTRNTIKRAAREVFRQLQLPACDCLVRLSRPVNGKIDPATSTPLKTGMRRELQWLFRSHFNIERQGEKQAEKPGEKRR